MREGELDLSSSSSWVYKIKFAELKRFAQMMYFQMSPGPEPNPLRLIVTEVLQTEH